MFKPFPRSWWISGFLFAGLLGLILIMLLTQRKDHMKHRFVPEDVEICERRDTPSGVLAVPPPPPGSAIANQYFTDQSILNLTPGGADLMLQPNPGQPIPPGVGSGAGGGGGSSW